MDSTLFKLSNYSSTDTYSVWNHINTFFHTLHYHNCIEIFIFHGTDGVHYVNGVEYQMNNNSMYILDTNDYHSIYNLSKKNNIFNLMVSVNYIDKNLLSKINHQKGFKYAQLDSIAAKQVDYLLEILELSTKSVMHYDDSFCKKIVESVFSIFFMFSSKEPQKDDLQLETTVNDKSFNKTLSYVTTHFKENITLEDVAKESGYSPSYLSDIFHKRTGYTFKEYILRSRISLAKRMLKCTNDTISFICYECGFSSMTSFLRNFTRLVKTTPTEYRNRHSD